MPQGTTESTAPSPKAGNGSFDQRYANRALVILSLLCALIVYIDVMLTPALPTIASEYHVSIAQTSLLISLYLVFGIAVMPIVGKLGDIYGKKRVMLATLGVYLAIATTTSFAPTFDLVATSRFFQGVGLGVLPLCFSLAREEFPRPLIPRAQGLISAVQVAGGAAGLLIGAVITSAYGWQGNYHVALPMILLLALLVALVVRESPNRKPGTRLDYTGAAWLGAALTAIVLGLSEGATWGWATVPTLTLLFGGLGALVPLALYETRRTEPVFDLRLLAKRNILISNLVILVFGISSYVAFQAITYYMQLPSPAGFGLSVIQTGLYLLPLVVVLLPVALVVGAVIPRFGVKPFLYLGSVFGVSGFLLLSTATAPLEVGAYLCLYALGSGMTSVAVQNLLVLSLEKSETGLGTALNSSFRYIGQSIGAPVAGAILSTYVSLASIGGHAVLLPTRTAFQLCFYTAGLAFIAVALIAFFAREVMGRRATTPLPNPPSEVHPAGGRT
jgi:MFS family permease